VRRIRKVIILLLIAFSLALSISCQTNKSVKTYIKQIPNTSTFVKRENGNGGLPGKGDKIYEEYYMIVNPPSDLAKLKKLIKYYDKNHVIKVKADAYVRCFFRNSKRMPENWKPDEGFFSIDEIEDHGSDMIAEIQWAKGSSKKIYIIYYFDSEGVPSNEKKYIE
jgi:hypothetical protein